MNQKQSEFEKAAAQRKQAGMLAEVFGFLKQNKKWWLLPILVLFLIFGLLITLSGSGLAPFIYPLF